MPNRRGRERKSASRQPSGARCTPSCPRSSSHLPESCQGCGSRSAACASSRQPIHGTGRRLCRTPVRHRASRRRMERRSPDRHRETDLTRAVGPDSSPPIHPGHAGRRRMERRSPDRHRETDLTGAAGPDSSPAFHRGHAGRRRMERRSPDRHRETDLTGAAGAPDSSPPIHPGHAGRRRMERRSPDRHRETDLTGAAGAPDSSPAIHRGHAGRRRMERRSPDRHRETDLTRAAGPDSSPAFHPGHAGRRRMERRSPERHGHRAWFCRPCRSGDRRSIGKAALHRAALESGAPYRRRADTGSYLDSSFVPDCLGSSTSASSPASPPGVSSVRFGRQPDSPEVSGLESGASATSPPNRITPYSRIR